MIFMKSVSFKIQIYIYSFSFIAGLVISLLMMVLKLKNVWCFKLKPNRISQAALAEPSNKSKVIENEKSLEITEAKTVQGSKNHNKNLDISGNDDNLSNNSSK